MIRYSISLTYLENDMVLYSMLFLFGCGEEKESPNPKFKQMERLQIVLVQHQVIQEYL